MKKIITLTFIICFYSIIAVAQLKDQGGMYKFYSESTPVENFFNPECTAFITPIDDDCKAFVIIDFEKAELKFFAFFTKVYDDRIQDYTWIFIEGKENYYIIYQKGDYIYWEYISTKTGQAKILKQYIFKSIKE